MMTAKLSVMAGAPLQASGKVELAPSQVYSTGNTPPSTTSGLLKVRPFAVGTAGAGEAVVVAVTALVTLATLAWPGAQADASHTNRSKVVRNLTRFCIMITS
jgi:hypothetical protein